MSTHQNSLLTDSAMPLYSPQQVNLAVFNSLKSPRYQAGRPVEDMSKFFHKQIIVDDETILDVETIKVPGFIGIADELAFADAQGNCFFGHEDIAQFLERDGLLIMTYQYNKDRYGIPVDLRLPPRNKHEQFDWMEIIIKNEGFHSGAIVPAMRPIENNKFVPGYACFNEPDRSDNALFGDKGFVSVAQRLLFPEFISKQQARGYTDSIICWMALTNPFIEFTENDINGGDPTRVVDRATLKQLLQNCVNACLGSIEAQDWLNQLENRVYCAEFMYSSLNTLVFPFNKQGLTLLLDGDEAKAIQILKLQDRHNRKQPNILSKAAKNSEFQKYHIPMPIVPEDLLPLDVLMAKNGQTIDPNSIPFPPFKLSQVLRRAFRTLLPRHQAIDDMRLAKGQTKLFANLEPMIFNQLRLNALPDDDPKVVAVRQFMALVKSQLEQKFNNYEEFDHVIDAIAQKADELIDVEDLKYFVPPRIYVDLGQNDGDENLPKGWGFRLETVGALIHRGAIPASCSVAHPNPQPPSKERVDKK
jgi:hypothetical protein